MTRCKSTKKSKRMRAVMAGLRGQMRRAYFTISQYYPGPPAFLRQGFLGPASLLGTPWADRAMLIRVRGGEWVRIRQPASFVAPGFDDLQFSPLTEIVVLSKLIVRRPCRFYRPHRRPKLSARLMTGSSIFGESWQPNWFDLLQSGVRTQLESYVRQRFGGCCNNGGVLLDQVIKDDLEKLVV